MPQHIAGMLGMPRRIYTYDAGRGCEMLEPARRRSASLFQAVGDRCSSCGTSCARCAAAQPAGDDPWDAWTLEWSTTSPPPEYNFETPPVVRSRRPLWDLKHPDDPDWRYE